MKQCSKVELSAGIGSSRVRNILSWSMQSNQLYVLGTGLQVVPCNRIQTALYPFMFTATLWFGILLKQNSIIATVSQSLKNNNGEAMIHVSIRQPS
jgi:hypothetical protein